MIAKFLSALWTAVAPALGNHLWQSTLFAVTAGLLTLALRKNRARVRYWVWLAASVKFLVPFSLLVGIGSHLGWSHGSAGTNPGLYVAIEQVGQPFSQPTALTISLGTPSTFFQALTQLLPALLAFWLCGFMVVILIWCMRWRRVSATIREGVPMPEGRELEALRRLERLAGTRRRIELLLSRTSLEPGIFGITRPVLIWPETISKRLGDSHLEAVLAHELCHVRRCDNLGAASHMLVEAIFWFHPLVWWLGARLLEERERACDEEVLESGSTRQIYAESILKICEFCAGSPLTCVSGVTGADLKKRIAHIMTNRGAYKLDFSRKLFLAAAGLLAVAAPLAFGLLHAPRTHTVIDHAQRPSIGLPTTQMPAATRSRPEFDFASVKSSMAINRDTSMNVPIGPEDVSPAGGIFSGTNARLIAYIYFAYNLTGNQFQALLPQLPKWVIDDRFDIQARAAGNPTKAQIRRMLQSLLAEHFKLAIHDETRQLPVFALVLAAPGKTGPQLTPLPDGSSCSTPPPLTTSDSESTAAADGFPTVCGRIVGLLPSNTPGRVRAGARNVPVGLLANTLAQMGNLDRYVLDQTGLGGSFNFTFEWTPQHNGALPIVQPGEPKPMFLRELREQLGLKLVSQVGTADVLVLDHIEHPSGN